MSGQYGLCIAKQNDQASQIDVSVATKSTYDGCNVTGYDIPNRRNPLRQKEIGRPRWTPRRGGSGAALLYDEAVRFLDQMLV